MAKYSTPGIRFTEIDNTVATESEPGMGIGAIVIASNKGPVNQRVVTKNYAEFTELFGKPETLESYGHFAAENYFANSTQLFAVRATMGDEQYAQIQYSYRGAPVTATNVNTDTTKFQFVDNEADNNLVLLKQLSAISDIEAMISGGDWLRDGEPEQEQHGELGFALKQKAYYYEFNDIISDTNDLIVFKAAQNDEYDFGNVIAEKGMHVVYPKSVDITGTDLQTDDVLFTSDAWLNYGATSADIRLARKGENTQVFVSVPASATLDKKSTTISFYGEFENVSSWSAEGVNYSEIFEDDNFKADLPDWDDLKANGYGKASADRIELMDWDTPDIKKTYYINDEDFTTGETSAKQAWGIKYTEYFNVDSNYAIVGQKNLDGGQGNPDYAFVSAVSAMYSNLSTEKLDWLGNDDIPARTPRNVIVDMMDAYGCNDISDINDYYYMKYYDVFTDSLQEKIIKEKPTYYGDVYEGGQKKESVDKEEFAKHVEEFLFWLYAEKDKYEFTKKSVFIAGDTEFITLPIQSDYYFDDKITGERITVPRLQAQPTSYITNSVDKTYADGYTLLTDAQDEPGNGDIEKYVSSFDDQLVIAAIGPGEYGNDIGISIITTECSEIPALQHQYAFNWKTAYDDEDKVMKDTTSYDENPLDLTWKKVFRINVYIKGKNQTADSAWGTGMDALLKEPVESWFVSTDPYAKDTEGNSLYAPVIINGHSDYIYVSRSSVSAAADKKGRYAQPNQTFAIYPLTGGKNSKKNNISEKTAALDFYKDRQRAKFDILFNVDAVDTFNGRQKYNAHMRKIAQIAASRTQDIGVVQVTSKSAKTAKQMVSESKNFAFQKGDFVAEYGGYDKYYNSDVAAWIYLPKSVAGACAMAYCDSIGYPWYAPAGVAHGTIGYTNGQLLRLTDDEIGQLYDNNVNTTRDCGGYGVVLWGQKTALKKNSLLNRINVRRCLNYIEKILENKMTPYLFMQNSVNTRSSARNDITEFLQRVKAAEGIYNYAVSVTADQEDPTIMNVAIQVWPTSAIEFIDIKININRQTGVLVTEG